jgi:hypothetical protein
MEKQEYVIGEAYGTQRSEEKRIDPEDFFQGETRGK